MAPQDWWFTGRTYKDGIKTPLLSYKCPSTAIAPAKPDRVTSTHQCKIHVDHDGDHICLCEKKWPNKTSQKENEAR